MYSKVKLTIPKKAPLSKKENTKNKSTEKNEKHDFTFSEAVNNKNINITCLIDEIKSIWMNNDILLKYEIFHNISLIIEKINNFNIEETENKNKTESYISLYITLINQFIEEGNKIKVFLDDNDEEIEYGDKIKNSDKDSKDKESFKKLTSKEYFILNYILKSIKSLHESYCKNINSDNCSFSKCNYLYNDINYDRAKMKEINMNDVNTREDYFEDRIITRNNKRMSNKNSILENLKIILIVFIFVLYITAYFRVR